MPINNCSTSMSKAQDPDFLKEWLEYEYSLTDKLQAITGDVHLDVIYQTWTQSSWWDRYMLQIDNTPVFLREILMKSQHTNYWYARTIIPQRCYDLNPDFFKRLEHEPIKNLIFDEPMVSRINRINYSIDKQCIEYFWVKKIMDHNKEILWARLAEFSFQQRHSFYLIELLFPELENIQ